MIFATATPILFTSFVYHTNVYCSVIHGIKIKPHLTVVWNWYHFVAIASPTDSADINTRLQLSDTSSLQPMHGGFRLIQTKWFVARYLQIVHVPNGGPRVILGNEIYIYIWFVNSISPWINAISDLKFHHSGHKKFYGANIATTIYPWASCQIPKIAGCACAGYAGNVFPATAGKRSRQVSRYVRHARAVMHAGIVN